MTDVDVPTILVVEMLSPTSSVTGTSIAGEVDQEIDLDDLGLPAVNGKTLHGLLSDVWKDLAPVAVGLGAAARSVLGTEGDQLETAILRVGNARLPQAERNWLAFVMHRATAPVARVRILDAMTTIDVRTAIDRRSGAPANRSLRRTRAVIPGVVVTAPLTWLRPPSSDELAVLALCTLGIRRIGLGRTRGRGQVRCHLGNWDTTVGLANAVGDAAV